jgi:hypothetical protein
LIAFSSWPSFVPAIHVFLACGKGVDARHKAGHDEPKKTEPLG